MSILAIYNWTNLLGQTLNYLFTICVRSLVHFYDHTRNIQLDKLLGQTLYLSTICPRSLVNYYDYTRYWKKLLGQTLYLFTICPRSLIFMIHLDKSSRAYRTFIFRVTYLRII